MVGLGLTEVGVLHFCWRDVPAVLVEPSVIELMRVILSSRDVRIPHFRGVISEAFEESVEDLLLADLTLVSGVVALGLQVGLNSMVVTKKVEDPQMDSKWQSISTGRAKCPLPNIRRCISARSLRISDLSWLAGRYRVARREIRLSTRLKSILLQRFCRRSALATLNIATLGMPLLSGWFGG